ncbi:hypothetical protein HAZT_HAZT010749, partial [Hyalella azteca]
RLCWTKVDGGPSLSLEYPHIAIHAVCRDITRFPRPHLYVMVDTDLFPEDHEESDDEDENADPEARCTSVRFVPNNLGNLDTIYQSVSNCQILHPDPEQESDNDDEDEGEYNLAGPLPPVRYENEPYEEQMENGLGEAVGSNGHGTDADEEAMDEDC